MIPASSPSRRVLQRVLRPAIARAAATPGADRYRKHFPALAHLWILVLYGLTVAPSLRQHREALMADPRLWRRIGLTRMISLSQVARSSTSRPSACVEHLVAEVLTLTRRRAHTDRIARRLYRVQVLDSTFLRLSSALSPWSQYGRHRPGVRLQTILDLGRQVPTHLHMSGIKENDRHAIATLDLGPYRGWTLLFDLGYYSHRSFARLRAAGVAFVSRIHPQAGFRVIAARTVPGHPTPDGDRLLADETIDLGSPNNRAGTVLPALRLVTSQNARGETQQFVTDRFDLTAVEIVRLYRKRWQIELFFRFLKHQLAMLRPIGYSPQAIWLTILLAVLMAAVLVLIDGDRPHAISRVAWLARLSREVTILLRGG